MGLIGWMQMENTMESGRSDVFAVCYSGRHNDHEDRQDGAENSDAFQKDQPCHPGLWTRGRRCLVLAGNNGPLGTGHTKNLTFELTNYVLSVVQAGVFFKAFCRNIWGFVVKGA